MSRHSLCHIFEAVGPYSAIGKVAMSDIRIALDAGYEVTVIAKRLDESLRPHVAWLPLYVPPRGFFFQWTTARHFIKRALGNRAFDIIHAHQPQVASLSDVFQCHFLTRVAYERKCLEERKTLRARAVRLQQQGVLHAEDFYYRRWNPNTWMLYDSALTRDEFHRLYGPCPKEDVLVYDFPPLNFASDADRAAARKKFLGEHHSYPGPVVGYLGGLQERKGYKRLLDALALCPDAFLLMGGPHSDNFSDARLATRMKSVGLVQDTPSFYAACDVLIVPSLFEPLGLVAFEAAARGTPVIATPEVGALPHLLEFHVGESWTPPQPLGPILHHIAASRESYLPGSRRMAGAFSLENYARRLRSIYQDVLALPPVPHGAFACE
jgi:glycosyltransferase involved in cell wall biosynthesis